MRNQTIQREISGIIIGVLFSLAIINPTTTFAETNGLNWDNPNQKNPFQLDAKTLINPKNAMALVGCTGIIDTATDAAMKLATKVVSQLLKLEKTVPVADSAVSKELKKSNRITACYNGLAYSLARQQLVSMTRSTMNWVNTGFNGDPMYVRNITSLTRNIEREVVNRELELLKDPKNVRDYPYGRVFAESQIRSYQSIGNFDDSMKSDLTGYLSDGATIDSFSKNFSEGGWGGWLALTQKDQNNPIGYSIQKSQQIDNQQEKEVTATKAELERNGGVLDQKKCAEYAKIVIKGTGGLMDMTTADPKKCIRYETITPGSLIKDKISKYLNSPETQLEMADSLNEVLYSIFGNLISRLQKTGLASLSSNTDDFSAVSEGIGANRIIDENGKDISSGNIGSGGYENESFDITKDLGGIIKDQEKYIATVEKLFPPLSNVMSKLGELDYCIPGPNPNWQLNSAYTKEAYITYLNSLSVAGSENSNRKYQVLKPSDNDPDVTDGQRNVFTNYLDGINDELTHFWSSLKDSWYFSRDGFETEYKKNASQSDLISRIAQGRTTEIDSTEAEYAQIADLEYGYKSPMQTELISNPNTGEVLGQNPKFLAMSQTGLNITKNIMAYYESISEMEVSYQDRIIETRSNIYKLNKIKIKVDIIVQAAEKRRAEARATAGLPAFTKECLANEKTIITQ